MNARNSKHQPLDVLKPSVAGAGLVTLDAVINLTVDKDVHYFAGGTCGNVLTILSYLGWDAHLISRLKDDLPAQWLLDDLAKWGVDTSLISRTDDGSTPIIIQKIKEADNGARSHSFSLRCSCCGAYLPGYKSILGKDAEDIANRLSHQQAFFFDRVSRGTLTLANLCAERGGLVVFEPAGIGEPRLFREAWSIAHVVKYSHDRLRDIADLDLRTSVRSDLLLEIETLGVSGLRYRSRLKNASTRGWKTLAVVPAATLKDAAGSGDWCTAGIIHKLAHGGFKGFSKVSSERLSQAFRYAQALATWNCAFESARGGMYCVTKQQFGRQIRGLLKGEGVRFQTDGYENVPEDLRRLCPTCGAADFSAHRRIRTGS